MTLVQVLPEHGNWKIRVDGEARDETFETQDDAAQEGRRLAKQAGAEFQLHATDGSIREKDSYGNDPRNIPG